MNTGIDWYRSGERIASMYANGDALNAGGQIREWLDFNHVKIRAATDVLQCFGEADFGQDLPLLLPDAGYTAGIQGCTWTTRVKIDQTEHKPMGTPGFLLGKYSTFSGMKFVGRCHDPNEDGGLIGWNEAMDATVRFEYCTFDSGERSDWSFYNWSAGKKSVYVNGGSGSFCRMGFCMMDSGSGQQSIEIRNFTATLDANGSKTYGESSNNNPETGGVLSLVAIRGGKATLRNVTVEATGLTAQYDTRVPPKFGCPRVAALVTDSYYNPGQPCQITVEGCKSSITPNMATVWNDIDLRRSSLKLIRHEGSGNDGLLKSWTK